MSNTRETKYYYGLKEFAEISNKNGINTSTEKLSVYRRRGLLPVPTVMIGTKAGWTKEQIESWIKEKKQR